MENLQSTTSRLRRTFAYDDDAASSSSSPSALDEQEQEELIHTLTQQNDARNGQFRVLLLCLCAVSTLPYLAGLVSPNSNSTSGGRWPALLSLTSLASTAWTLWTLPPGVTGVRVLDAWVAGGGSTTHPRRRKRDDDDVNAPFWAEEHRRSPLATYLPYLNAGLCAVLVLAGLLSKSAASQGRWGHFRLSNLPAIVYGVVLVSKMVMGGVDPEKELSALRYEYKGA
ncbi:hypothetical protein F4804DRAFT_305361 [Jackrogersella minutella]|nr:hypothetical protein F4804DRAFT_305361 [Jackrogersella minutella]